MPPATMRASNDPEIISLTVADVHFTVVTITQNPLDRLDRFATVPRRPSASGSR